MNRPDLTKWISTKTAMMRTGYGQTYIARLCREGKLRAIELDNGILIDPDSLSEYVKAHPRKRRGMPSLDDAEDSLAVAAAV